MITIARFSLIGFSRDRSLITLSLLMPIVFLTLFGLALGSTRIPAEAFQRAEHPWASYYAAALAALFLLFTAARAAELLRDEEESRFLARLRLTPIAERDLIGGKALALFILLLAELHVLFLFGQVVFGIELFAHLVPFFLFSSAAALCATAIGLLLAAAAPSRHSLTPLALLLILAMALPGGSILPEFFLPDWVARAGRFTFNHQVISGYAATFGGSRALASSLPFAARLAVCGLVLLIAAMALTSRRLRLGASAGAPLAPRGLADD
jgi:ABC-2 type transport system permease protein